MSVEQILNCKAAVKTFLKKLGLKKVKKKMVILRQRAIKKIYRKKYNTNDVICLMQSMGMKKGSTVFVHSSWADFYNYTGTIEEFINAILDVIGKDGTLAMPAYPLAKHRDKVFDVKRTVTAAGYIAETFRHYPDVKRSANAVHSVCARGPNADFLLSEHQYSSTPFDDQSPYFRLAQCNALIFSFGLGKYFITTAIHSVESKLKDELPYFNNFFIPQISRVKLDDGSIYEQHCAVPNMKIKYTTEKYQFGVVKKHFDKSKYFNARLSNMHVNMYEARYLHDRLVQLARVGIVMYILPDPKKYIFPK